MKISGPVMPAAYGAAAARGSKAPAADVTWFLQPLEGGPVHQLLGYEQVHERTINFAGEHTAPEDQGFLSGGVVSGERAAAEVQHQV